MVGLKLLVEGRTWDRVNLSISDETKNGDEAYKYITLPIDIDGLWKDEDEESNHSMSDAEWKLWKAAAHIINRVHEGPYQCRTM